MEKIASKITNYLLATRAISEENYFIYKYGFQVGLELSLCIAICITVAMQIGMTFESVIFFVLFFKLRSYVGGMHLKHYYLCFTLSVAVHLSILMLTKYLCMSKNLGLTIIALSSLILLLTRSVEHDNRKIDMEEEFVFCQKKKRNISFIFMISLVLYFMGVSTYITLIAYTLLTIAISLILGNVINTEK